MVQHKLKMMRRAAKAALSRLCSTLSTMMEHEANVDDVHEKLDLCQERYNKVEELHLELVKTLIDDSARAAADRYWVSIEDKFATLHDKAISYIQHKRYEEQQRLQESVKPHDSISNTSSHGTKSTRSSAIRDALAKAKVKSVTLKAQADQLEKLQQLEMRKMALVHEEKQAQLECELKIAAAVEDLLQGSLSEVTGLSTCHKKNQQEEESSRAEAMPSQPQVISSLDTGCQAAPPARESKTLNPQAQEWSPSSRDEVVVLTELQRQHQTMVDLLQLPKTELPQFNGDPMKYYMFMQAFDNVVGKTGADPSAKLARLVQYCTGRARKIIECCMVMEPEQGYIRAREMLAERFGNAYTISDAWIHQVAEGPPLRSSDPAALQTFADDLKSCRETLQAMNLLTEVDTQKSLSKIVQRLPSYLQSRWRKSAVSSRRVAGKYPGFAELTWFVEQAAEEANDPVFGLTWGSLVEKFEKQEKQAPQVKRSSGSSFSAMAGSDVKESVDNCKQLVCTMCSQGHSVFSCEKFKAMKPEERYKWVRSKQLCDNCLRPGHFAARCRKPTVCTICGKKHTRFLHLTGGTQVGKPAEDSPTAAKSKSQVTDSIVSASSGFAGAAKSHAIAVLPIVPVKVKGKGQDTWRVTYALLDGGSTNTFCSEELLQDLSMQGDPTSLMLTTLEKENSETPATVVSLEVISLDDTEMVHLPRVYSRPKLTVGAPCMPSREELNKWEHLRNLKLPRVEQNVERVDLLIGQDVPDALVPLKVLRGKANQPYAVCYSLGWTLNGPLAFGASYAAICNFVQADAQQLNNNLERFWKIDSVDAFVDGTSQMSKEDLKALSILEKSKKIIDGHYQMAIPFKTMPVKLQNNREVAERRLESLKRRLKRDVVLCEKYSQGITDLLAKGYAELVEDRVSDDTPVWYLPHHPVISSAKKGKVRIVFDCGAKFNGTSLNDQVLQGPDLTNNLLGVLLRFREGKIAIMGDIEAMYHQVLVPQADRNVLSFLYWKNSDLNQKVIELRMTRHLFGGVWSPCVANYALQQTAEDNAQLHDAETVETVLRSFYVDDCLRSHDDADRAIALVKDLRELLARGGFNLVKWISNDRRVMEAIPDAVRAGNVRDLDLTREALPTERALGVRWNVETDQFEISVKNLDKPPTRRGVMSAVCSIYDPLGLVSPLVLPAKLLCQELSRQKLGWDDPIPEEVAEKWTRWQTDLLNLACISMPRCVKPESFGCPTSCQLHHFADASQVGYGAVSYLRLTNANGEVHCTFIISKTRLAPLKTMTIPRLELSAAVIAAKLDHKLRKELQMDIDESYFWTDSQVVLQYLKNEERRFHTFVANRVSQVHALSDPVQWRHVKSAVNPADMASRGLSVKEFLIHKEWLTGPDFLYEPDAVWCTKDDVTDVPSEDEEVKMNSRHAGFMTVQAEKPALDRLLEKYSSWIGLQKAVAWFLRLKAALKCRVQKKELPIFGHRLSVDELAQAEGEIIRYVQNQTLDEARTSGRLRGLTPMVDGNGILCVGGRLQNAPVNLRMKHQMILPKGHHVVDLIIQHFHRMSAHAGLNYVLSLTRERYWIIGGRGSVRRVLKDCVKCRRLNARPAQQKMADLPEDRVKPFEPAFTYVGVDCFGPFEVKRGRITLKRYGCLFTCLVIRAIHIEVLQSLDAHSFMNALHRFMARRGCPKIIRSDNGTNFTAAERELRNALREWNESNVPEVLMQKGVTWMFNPPASSHMGGAWERLIRSVRRGLNSLKDEQVIMNDEGLATLMCLVEAAVNGRPITRLSDDPRDCEALTPNHLLLLKPGCTLPPGIFVKEDVFRRRWKQAQYLANVFWRRWLHEYLPTQQLRQKWSRERENFHVGDIVLVVDENTPRGLWPLGRVICTYPGKDGLVRSVQLKTRSTTLTRPIHKLCLLESVNQ